MFYTIIIMMNSYVKNASFATNLVAGYNNSQKWQWLGYGEFIASLSAS